MAKTLSMPGHSWFIQTVTLSNCVSFDLIEKVVPCKSFYRPSPPVPGRENRDVSILRGGPDVPCYFFLVHVAKKRANGTISYLGKEHTATRKTLDWFAAYGYNEEWLKALWTNVGRYELMQGIDGYSGKFFLGDERLCCFWSKSCIS